MDTDRKTGRERETGEGAVTRARRAPLPLATAAEAAAAEGKTEKSDNSRQDERRGGHREPQEVVTRGRLESGWLVEATRHTVEGRDQAGGGEVWVHACKRV